jgi:4-amino-4-deoxy-L-arabinose transferase-like glycosyltransferase
MAWLLLARARLRALDGWIVSARGTAALFSAVTVCGLLIRLWIVLVAHPPGEHVYSDMWVYEHRAEHLGAWKLGPWDTFTPMGYPALLALLRALFGPDHLAASLANAVAGALACGLTALVARRVTESGLAAIAAGTFAVVHWPWLHYTAFLLSETWFTLLFMLSVWLLLRARERRGLGLWGLAGLALGAAVTVRANAATALLIVPFLVWGGRARFRGALGEASAVLLGASLPLALTAVVYTSAAGRVTLAPTNGGLNFYLNVSDVKRVEYQGNYIEPIPNAVRFREVEAVAVPFYEQEHYYARGLSLLRKEPRRFARLLFNLRELTATGRQSYWPGWDPLPNAARIYARVFFGFVIVPALLWAALLLFRARVEHGPTRHFTALVLLASAIGPLVYLGDPRMRVPFDGLLLIATLDAYLRLTRGAILERGLRASAERGLRASAERGLRASAQEASAGSGRTNAGAEAISP